MRQGAPSVWLLALVPFALLVLRFDFVCDDAFITYRYADNLARGLGLRYNPGVEPPVEGYTDLGWVLWTALLHLVRPDDVPLLARLTTVACGALLLGLVARTVSRAGGGAVATAAAAFAFATFPGVAVWSTGGLGTMAFALCVFAAAERLLGPADRPRGLAAGAYGAAAALLRADGAFWLLATGVLARLLRSDAPARREVRRFALVSLAAVAALTAFRVAHHGDWVPNTARAKVAFSALTLERGAMYLGAFWTVLPAGLLVPLATLPLAVGERRRGATLAAGSLGLVLATFAYGVLVGGDFMAFHRFFLPALPFLAVLVGLLAEAARGRGRPLVALAVPALVVATSLPPAFGAHLASEPLRKATHFRWDLGYTPELAFWNGMKDRAERWSVLGRALELHTEEGESIVMGTIGAAGYYSRLFVFDRRGLVTPEVNDVPLPEGARTTPGHDRQVPASFFLARNPTYLDAYVLPAGAPTPPGTPTRRIERRPLPVEAGFPPERTLVLVLPAGRRGR